MNITSPATSNASSFSGSLVGHQIIVDPQQAQDFTATYGYKGLNASDKFTVVADGGIKTEKIKGQTFTTRMIEFENSAGVQAAGNALRFLVAEPEQG